MIKRIKENYTVQESDKIIFVDTSKKNIEIRLPKSAYYSEVKVIRTTGANEVKIMYNNKNLFTINSTNDIVNIFSDGENWYSDNNIYERLNEKSIPTSTQNKLPDTLLRKIKNKYSLPVGFEWKNIPINIFKNGLGEFSTDFSLNKFKTDDTGKTYYVDVNNGNASNDGLSKSTALKSIAAARLKEDVSTIIVAGGFYEDQYGFNNTPASRVPSRDITIKGAPGEEVIITTARLLNWSKTSTATNVYQSSRTQLVNVYDNMNKNEDGTMKKMKLVESIALCDSTPNSYFYDGAVVYIHTFDSRQPTKQSIIPFLDLVNFVSTGEFKIILQNLKFWGGRTGAVNVQCSTGDENPWLIADNCEFDYSQEGNGGLTSLGYNTLLNNCKTFWNKRDGFNYHKSGTKIANGIEINCEGAYNGIGRESQQDNGSTMHDGGKVLRINGKYHHNEGPNVHDINEGMLSLNLGCESFKSLATVNDRNVCYQVETGKMWLDSCIGYDSSISIACVNNGKLYLTNSLFDDGRKFQKTGGIVEYY